MKRTSIALAVLAGLALLAAAYNFSFGIPLEAACHMGDTSACERLAFTMNWSAATAVGGLGLGAAAAVLFLIARRRHGASAGRTAPIRS